MSVEKDMGGLWCKIRKNRRSYILMAPFMICFLLFTAIPVIVSVILSFTYFNMLQFPQWRGLLNYSRLFLEDDIMLIAVRNTLVFAFLTGPLSYFMCFLFAWLINELSRGLRAFVTIVFYAPSISGTVFVIWTYLFSGDSYGFINGLLINLGLINEPINWLIDPKYNLTVLIICQLWLSLGTGFLAFIAGLQGIDGGLYEAGAIDGIKNRFQELWYITLPSMAPLLLFGAVMQIIGSFSVGQISVQLCGFPSTNYSAETVVTHMMDYGSIRFEMGYASAIATVLFVFMYITQRFLSRTLGKIGD